MHLSVDECKMDPPEAHDFNKKYQLWKNYASPSYPYWHLFYNFKGNAKLEK